MSTWFETYGFAEVYPDLVVGAYPLDSDDVATLGRLGIARVLNLVEESEYQPGLRAEVARALRAHGIEETRASLIDFGRLPHDQLEGAVSTLVEWMKAGDRIYLHCRAGWQRSAAVAAGAVAVIEGIDVVDALRAIQVRKPSANPLPHQRADLVEWWAARALRNAR